MQSVHPLEASSLQEVPLCARTPHIPPKRGLLKAIKLPLRLRSQFPKVLPSEASSLLPPPGLLNTRLRNSQGKLALLLLSQL